MLPVKELQSTVPGPPKYGHVTVGTSAVALSSISRTVKKGVILRAPGSGDPTANTDPIWIGDSRVTANSAADTGGFPIAPGESVTIEIEDLSEIYAISANASQDLGWIGV